ncbi:MAG: carboxypeptidase-like regulatory domain-containing protein [Methanoregula sp.]|nr:carboxypeptidase-like regulatory domain-containing protein [Methanoregula sp.]
MQISATNMTVSYGVKTDAWGANYPAEGVYQLRFKNVGDILPAKVINLNMATPQGRARLDLQEVFFDNEDAEYGWYTAQLYRDEVLLDQQWFGYYNGGGSIAFGEDAYVSSQTATISHTITYFTFGEFEYRGQVIDLQGTEKESWSITSASGSHPIDLTDYTTGTYVVLLQATDRDTGDEYVFAADTATVNQEVWVNGTAYNAETGAPLSGVTVTIQQLDATATNVTIEDGSYAAVTGLYTDNAISVNASATNYTHSNFTFTPLSHGLKTVNLYLVPTTPTFSGTAIGGLVYNTPYRQAVGGATVTIENDTWSATNTTNSAGYYLFEDLVEDGTYTVSSTQTGYQPSTEYTATAGNATFTPQDIQMEGIYSLTLELRDATDHSLIDTSLTVEAGSATNTTTAGQTMFHNLDYGIVTVTVSGNENYYGTSENVLVEEDTTETIYLTRKTEGTPFAYPPHNVKFVVRSAFGGLVEGVTVEATGYETTMGEWSWLFDILGIDYETTQIHNQTMSGTTGSDGAIDFMMIEAIKYRVTLIKEGEVNTTWEGYPKDDHYEIWASDIGSAWFEHGYNPLETVNVTIAGTTADETSATLTIYYNDTLLETTTATAYLNQTHINGTETAIDSHTETDDAWNHTFTIAGDHRGESYVVRLRAAHETFGNISRDYGVHYKPAPISLGLPEDLLLYGAMGILIFTALFFGQTSVGAGCIIVALEGWLFFWMGWWRDLGSEYAVGTVLVIITFVAFLVNVMHRSKKERYA